MVASTWVGVRRSAEDDMLDSLIRSPGRLLVYPHTIPLFSPCTKSKGAITPEYPLPLHGYHSLVWTLS